MIWLMFAGYIMHVGNSPVYTRTFLHSYASKQECEKTRYYVSLETYCISQEQFYHHIRPIASFPDWKRAQ